MLRRPRISIRIAGGALVALGFGLALAPARVDAGGGFRPWRMVVIGDSVLAGFGSGGLVARGATGQQNDAPALIARAARRGLPQPLMRAPGVPPPLHINDANGDGRLEAGDVQRGSTLVGFRSNTDTRARNLAVPGESILSVFETVQADRVVRGLVAGDISGRDILKFLILGFPLTDAPVSQLNRARRIHPSFLLVWLGNNDVLPMATKTNPAAATMTAASFGAQYRLLLDRLADTGADMAVANLPDVTHIAALRRAATDVTSCQDGSGTPVAVPADALLSIGLAPSRLPVPPCGRVLLPADQVQIRATVMAFNAEIAAAVADVELRRGRTVALVDMFALFDDVAEGGYDVRGDGSLVLDNRYLGGLFSLDGVHPTRTGQALIANAFIDAIDARFGATMARVDVSRIAAGDPYVASGYRPAGEPPFGLIANQDIDIGDTLDDAFTNLLDNAGDLFDSLRDRARHFIDRFF